MPRVSVRFQWPALAGLFLMAVLLAAASAPVASADEGWQDDSAHWLCRPGDTPNPCAGPVEGKLISPEIPPPGQTLGYRAATNPKVDCFYVYPTQSEQQTPNANFAKDPELLRPTINQATQFSRQCRVFAPVYRQYTQWALSHPEEITPEVRDLAFNDVKAAWDTYLKKYNRGRGVIILGHSQGSMHLGWLMQNQVDSNPAVRRKVIGAYLIGGNVYVPKGKLVGGQFKHIPACTSGSETGCVVAYSTYLEEPAADSDFGRAGIGYWINPHPAPNPATDEILCVNPAGFNGDNGRARVMADIPAFLSPGAPQPAAPWKRYDGFYTASCKNENGASWLQGEPVPGQSNPELDMLLSQAASSNGSDPHGNLHVADVNLALDNLVALAGTQSAAWLKKDATRSKLLKQQKQLKKSLKQLKRKAAKAKKQCRKAKRGSKAKRVNCRKAGQLKKMVKKTGTQLTRVQRQLGKLG